LEQVEFFF